MPLTGIVQINLQPHFGGGEVYTAFLCRALDQLGVASTLFAHPDAHFWTQLDLPASTVIERVADAGKIAAVLPKYPLWLLGHGPLPAILRDTALPHRLRTAIAHMPLQGRNPRAFDGHDRVFPVSAWVREGLLAAGVPAWPAPLYGVAELRQRPGSGEIRRNSRYDWDRRKVRDRLLGRLEPLSTALRSQPHFTRSPGLTLGIVSRLTPIKQFPLLFSLLVPVLQCHPELRIEIFGSGGYASVRDLQRALAPIAGQVRYWGHQADVRAVYAQLDYLLTGLPEKEALGLNVIEAQSANLPVLAVRAPPFTETVAEGLTGFFYRDPREDAGTDFARLLEQIVSRTAPLRPAEALTHLAQFSFAAFVERLRPVVAWAAAELHA